MYKLTQAGVVGTLVLIAGYVIGALIQGNFVLGSWPLPVRLLIVVFAGTAFVMWAIVVLCFEDEKNRGKVPEHARSHGRRHRKRRK